MFNTQYKQKLTSAEQAVQLIKRNANIAFGMAVSQPPALLAAIANRAKARGFDELRVYYLHAEEPANNTILQYELMDVIKPHPGFLGSKERQLIKQGDADNGRKVIFYVPNSFSHMPRYFREAIDLDTCVVTVSPMDKSGYFTFGTNNDYTSTAARCAKKLIVEVNENMPRVFGDSLVHISEVDAIVENTVPLVALNPRAPLPEDKIIGEAIAKLIPDGATIQMGVGGVPDAVCQYLLNHNDLGIHSELLSPGMVDLVRKGIVTGKKKNINRSKHVFTLAFGDEAMYEYINDNPSMETYPVDYVNNPSIISQNDNVISVNALIEIDLYGQVNAENIHGRQFGGPGGQNDFVRGAYLSKGGKSILAFESTAKQAQISKIVPKLSGVVTDLRIDTQYVATEYGVINLKGLSSTERAKQLISIAHPNFRDELSDQAKALHLL
ncbi:acetyl-CoA hydrolase/transferase family protein [Pusillimonas sp. DMV24BSW_D]|jgi:itaconate CoA-transferase|uniref:4-hydroxybutyrate CoA-transferase n=1 Tax=Neopusillimonas maritima TaxID=2026239 RepID=A0A3A1YQN1_9BURK|nr:MULTISPECIES: acetyl-CoA hydrolase/transferase C-terminal domain-containing protein [Alcaligenaceae]MBF24514.1 4-hydroxybutyrate CoA-transferase [Pusillimonas sp.]QIM49365.1 acetyl-CoA hydrolase/transferase family protein [Pusillimonas sp. DMV24BSW_D]RIY39549.1 4-hydroxybutyrate CoA-transferase [Neopusillimonas maritima]|tara:strand:- start:3659 stop:4975 length:1317 start_codon:yes stop_codon:yes gene_type:complete